MNLQQVVMNAEEAAGLTAVLKPTLAVPHHYTFHSGWLGDRMITKGESSASMDTPGGLVSGG